jgi:hypothetical protein
MDRTTTLEQVIYRLRPDATEADFLAANAAAQAWLETQPGFLAREMAVSPDGLWVDHVWWADLASAEAAAATFLETPAGAAMGKLLDEASATFRHCRIVLSVRGVAAGVAAVA